MINHQMSRPLSHRVIRVRVMAYPVHCMYMHVCTCTFSFHSPSRPLFLEILKYVETVDLASKNGRSIKIRVTFYRSLSCTRCQRIKIVSPTAAYMYLQDVRDQSTSPVHTPYGRVWVSPVVRSESGWRLQQRAT